MKMILGTAQFGTPYGISNRIGQVGKEDVALMLAVAQDYGFSGLDTAAAYGDSEHVLGEIPESQYYDIYTKLPKLLKSDFNLWKAIFNQSLEKLKRPYINGLFLHDADDLCGENQENVYSFLCDLKEKKLTNKIGVSVYSVDQLNHIIDNYDIDLVQLPLNIFDQRFVRNNFLKKLKEKDIEIHVRSVFLQGLLLMSVGDVPRFLKSAIAKLTQLDHFCHLHKMSRLSAVLQYIYEQKEVDAIVLGMTSLQELIQISDSIPQLPYLTMDWRGFSIDDESIIIPKNWKH